MARPRFSVRGLLIAVAVVGFDAAAMSRAVHQGRLVHAVADYATGFGLVLLVLNLVIIALAVYFTRQSRLPATARLNATPPPLVIFGLYAVVVSVAILSVLFLTSGRF
jgi:hypothetical protein